MGIYSANLRPTSDGNQIEASWPRTAIDPGRRPYGAQGGPSQFCNYHLAKVSNGPTEALDNLIKRIKRIGFGFRNFENYRIRALLYADRPNWRVPGSIVVR